MYNLSNTVDPNKIFLVKYSELVGRFDPIYYNSVNELQIVNNTTYPVKKLGEVVTMQRGRFGHRPRNAPEFYDGQYPFIQTGNVVEASKSNGRIKYSQTLNELGLSTSRLFQPNVLVITIAANIGDTAILDYPACFPDSLVALYPKGDVDIYYLNYYLKFIKSYLESLAPQSAQKNINLQQLNPIPVIIPPKTIQLQIAELLTNAYTAKQQKEAEAKALLEGIDAYLLGELGISLPEQDNSLEKRIFITKLGEITNGRYDSYYYQDHFKKFFSSLSESIYPVHSIAEIAKKIASGITPLSGGDAYTTLADGIPFIRSGNITIDGQVEYDDLLYLKPEIHHRVMKSSKLIKNDLMIAIVGATIGQVGIYLDDREANINQAIALVRLKPEVNAEYVKELIKSSIGQMNLNRLKRPVARANINLEEISTIKIVLPPLEKQAEIANHIQNIRSRAKALQHEAASVLEDAKREVEKMILGE
jgi:restriction endonuclease S subunit